MYANVFHLSIVNLNKEIGELKSVYSANASYFQIYPPITNDKDLIVYAGELVFRINEDYGFNEAPLMGGTNLNIIKLLMPNGALTPPKNQHYQILLDKLEFVGVALENTRYDSKHPELSDDINTAFRGVCDVMNTSDFPINPGEILLLDIPDPNSGQYNRFYRNNKDSNRAVAEPKSLKRGMSDAKNREKLGIESFAPILLDLFVDFAIYSIYYYLLNRINHYDEENARNDVDVEQFKVLVYNFLVPYANWFNHYNDSIAQKPQAPDGPIQLRDLLNTAHVEYPNYVQDHNLTEYQNINACMWDDAQGIGQLKAGDEDIIVNHVKDQFVSEIEMIKKFLVAIPTGSYIISVNKIGSRLTSKMMDYLLEVLFRLHSRIIGTSMTGAVPGEMLKVDCGPKSFINLQNTINRISMRFKAAVFQ